MSPVQDLPVVHDGMDAWKVSRTDRRLEQELIENTGAEVRLDPGTSGAYSTDASNYRQVPLGVVIPTTIDGVPIRRAECGLARRARLIRRPTPSGHCQEADATRHRGDDR